MVQPTRRLCLVRGADLAALLCTSARYPACYPRYTRMRVRSMLWDPWTARRAKTAGGAVMHMTTVTAAAYRRHPRSVFCHQTHGPHQHAGYQAYIPSIHRIM